jgi:hypothetical protein
MDTAVSTVTHVIQLAVAPVFLLTAVATLISGLNLRLGRIVDRRRVLLDRRPGLVDEALRAANDEMHVLSRRIWLVYSAIFSAVSSALLVCLVVAIAFVGALFEYDLSRFVAVLFVLAMLALIVCLGIFLREIYLAVGTGTHRIR